MCRFIPRHADELELDVDDPLFVEEEEDDYWYRGYNMRTGERGIFPAFYAHEVMGQSKELTGKLGEAVQRGAHTSSPLLLLTLPPVSRCRPEEESSLDGNLQCAVLGLCGGSLPPRQRDPLCCHAEGERVRNSLVFRRGRHHAKGVLHKTISHKYIFL